MNYEWGWVHDTDSEWLVYGDIKLYCKVHVLVLYITLPLRESPTSHLCLSSPETSAAECWGRPSWSLSQESPVIMLECSMYFSFGQVRCPCEHQQMLWLSNPCTHVSLQVCGWAIAIGYQPVWWLNSTLWSHWCRGADSTLSFWRPVFSLIGIECWTNGGLAGELSGLGVKLPGTAGQRFGELAWVVSLWVGLSLWVWQVPCLAIYPPTSVVVMVPSFFRHTRSSRQENPVGMDAWQV